MTKAQVVEEIGGPDRVLRDDGRMLVWEYSLTARRQWLYELGLCPVSVWIGGCIIYPFTNIAMEHQREYPHHVVLVNDELCAWGPRRHPTPPQSLRVHRLSVRPHGWDDGSSRTGGDGARTDQPRHHRSLQDDGGDVAGGCAGAPGSGSRVAGIVTTLLLDLDINMVERAKLDEVLKNRSFS